MDVTDDGEITDPIISFNRMRREAWLRGDLSFLLDSLQRQIRETCRNTAADKVCILSSRQIGKSYFVLCYALEFLIRNPGSIVRVVASTLKQVSDIVADNLAKIVDTAPSGFVERAKSDYRWHVKGGSLRLGSLERAHVDNNRGGHADLIITEEGGFVSSDDFAYGWRSVLRPQLLRAATDGPREIHITSPSEDEYHHIHEVIKPQCEELGTFFSYDVYASPSITAEQIEQAKKDCGGEQSDTWRREYLAQIIRSSTLTIIPEFDEARHVREFQLPSHYKHLFAFDMGGSIDFTGGSVFVWDFELALVLIWDELFLPPNTSTEAIATHGKEVEARWQWKQTPRYMDAPAQLLYDLQFTLNYPCTMPNKQDKLAGINALRKRFSESSILIHPRCPHTIRALKMGRWSDRKRDDFARNELIGHADQLAALIYGNRCLDTWTDPFPVTKLDRDTQMKIDYRSKPTGLENVAGTLMPFNPMRDRQGWRR